VQCTYDNAYQILELIKYTLNALHAYVKGILSFWNQYK